MKILNWLARLNSWVQWAAVTIQFSFKILPPQNWRLPEKASRSATLILFIFKLANFHWTDRRLNNTCHGNDSIWLSSPPTTRNFSLAPSSLWFFEFLFKNFFCGLVSRRLRGWDRTWSTTRPDLIIIIHQAYYLEINITFSNLENIACFDPGLNSTPTDFPQVNSGEAIFGFDLILTRM